MKLDQKLASNHVPVLLVVGQIDVFGHRHPAIDVAVEHRRPVLFISHMNVFEPVEVLPTHPFNVGLQKRCNAFVVGYQVDIIPVTDVLPDGLFPF